VSYGYGFERLQQFNLFLVSRVGESDCFVRLQILEQLLHHTLKLEIPVEMVQFFLKIRAKILRTPKVYLHLCYLLGRIGHNLKL